MRARNVLATAILILCLSAAGARADATLHLAAEVREASGYLRLGQLATIDGDEGTVERLKKVFVCPAPREGTGQILARGDVERRLREMGLRMNVRVTGAEEVLVLGLGATRAQVEKQLSEAVSEPAAYIPDVAARADVSSAARREQLAKAREMEAMSMALAAVEQFLGDEYSMPGVEATVHVRKLHGEIGDTIFSMQVNRVARGDVPGRSRLVLALRNLDDKTVGFAEADVEVEMTARVFVAVRSIRSGETVQPTDFSLRTISLRGSDVPDAFDPQKASGWVARERIQEGEPARLASFVPPPVIRPGQVVLVDVQGRGFSIKEYATALEAGRVGDFIALESVQGNPRTKYRARISGPGRVDLPVGQ